MCAAKSLSAAPRSLSLCMKLAEISPALVFGVVGVVFPLLASVMGSILGDCSSGLSFVWKIVKKRKIFIHACSSLSTRE